jgi:hypothetical protein
MSALARPQAQSPGTRASLIAPPTIQSGKKRSARADCPVVSIYPPGSLQADHAAAANPEQSNAPIARKIVVNDAFDRPND